MTDHVNDEPHSHQLLFERYFGARAHKSGVKLQLFTAVNVIAAEFAE
jgi:hypothetical protein